MAAMAPCGADLAVIIFVPGADCRPPPETAIALLWRQQHRILGKQRHDLVDATPVHHMAVLVQAVHDTQMIGKRLRRTVGHLEFVIRHIP